MVCSKALSAEAVTKAIAISTARFLIGAYWKYCACIFDKQWQGQPCPIVPYPRRTTEPPVPKLLSQNSNARPNRRCQSTLDLTKPLLARGLRNACSALRIRPGIYFSNSNTNATDRGGSHYLSLLFWNVENMT